MAWWRKRFSFLFERGQALHDENCYVRRSSPQGVLRLLGRVTLLWRGGEDVEEHTTETRAALVEDAMKNKL